MSKITEIYCFINYYPGEISLGPDKLHYSLLRKWELWTDWQIIMCKRNVFEEIYMTSIIIATIVFSVYLDKMIDPNFYYLNWNYCMPIKILDMIFLVLLFEFPPSMFWRWLMIYNPCIYLYQYHSRLSRFYNISCRLLVIHNLSCNIYIDERFIAWL